MYSETVWHHFRNPKNRGEMADANGVGSGHFAKCGDHFELYVKLEGERIAAARFEAHACAPVIAMGSVGTQMIQGMTRTEALQLSAYQLDEAMGGLPGPKRHAILLFLQSLHQALKPESGP